MAMLQIVNLTVKQAVKLAASKESGAQQKAALDASLKTAAFALSLAWGKDVHLLLSLLRKEAAK